MCCVTLFEQKKTKQIILRGFILHKMPKQYCEYVFGAA